MADDASILRSLESHGESLAVGLGIVASDAFDDGTLEMRAGPAFFLPLGQVPEECPRRGLLFRHTGELNPPSKGAFALGWFLSEETRGAIESAAGSPEQAPARMQTLAIEFAENLATDKYKLTDTTSVASEDLQADYLAGELPSEVAWQKFVIAGKDHTDWTLFLAWPRPVVERMFGSPATPAAGTPPPAPSPGKPAPQGPSPNVRRLLRTEVPVIVTLASKLENAGKLLHLGPGSIIEFSQSCDSPLQLSINNLPIGLGEAVKIGDHFGLKIVEIVPAEERLERLGTKWPY
jgi:flagellar motor switch/type III secretory pathway protein FliN